ncbi:MAG: NUDIX hydrolase [Phycisphaerales bacterium]|nr:NUDIX hydrolase [Phycisphaerales bacterium]
MPSTIHRQRVYDCPIFSVEECKWTAKDGSSVARSVIRHPGAVLIVPELDQDHFVMIRNFRVAVGEALWEFPAGTLEPGEPPIDTAARELTEETGYVAGTIEPLGRFYTSPGFADELMHVFVARNLIPGAQHLEPHEEIEVSTHGRSDVETMVQDGRLVDGKSIAALLLWQQAASADGD